MIMPTSFKEWSPSEMVRFFGCEESIPLQMETQLRDSSWIMRKVSWREDIYTDGVTGKQNSIDVCCDYKAAK